MMLVTVHCGVLCRTLSARTKIQSFPLVVVLLVVVIALIKILIVVLVIIILIFVNRLPVWIVAVVPIFPFTRSSASRNGFALTTLEAFQACCTLRVFIAFTPARFQVLCFVI